MSGDNRINFGIHFFWINAKLMKTVSTSSCGGQRLNDRQETGQTDRQIITI